MTAPRLLLLRHAVAGSRETWRGDDRERPLDPRGREQAARLPEHLAGHLVGPVAVLSSPVRRCVTTVEPIAAAWGSRVEVDERLAERAPPLRSSDGWPDAAWLGARALAPVDEALVRHEGGTLVVCSHGEVLPALLAALVGARGRAGDEVAGIDLTAKALPKGAAWVVTGAGDGLVVEQVPAPP